MYQGQTLQVSLLDSGLAELTFNHIEASVNVIDKQTIREIRHAAEALSQNSSIKGLLISSGKPMFILGANITRFPTFFSDPVDEVKQWVMDTHDNMGLIENLPFPIVSAVNGMALGGGLEMALMADFLVLADDARIGLPEVNLGLCPGWGGTVRSSRLMGVEASLNMMLTGKPITAKQALEYGMAARVAPALDLRAEALQLLQQAIDGEIDYRENRARKHNALEITDEIQTQLDGLKIQWHNKLDPNYPAAGLMLDTVIQHCRLPFIDALSLEGDIFIDLAKSDQSKNLVTVFLNDQHLKRQTKSWLKQSTQIKQAAVLGAGIMGGGVAYQSASTGTSIVMKDITEDALSLGAKTATKLLDRQIQKGRLDEAGKNKVLTAITPTLNYDAFKTVDLVVEAVVENESIKAGVLADVEKRLPDHAIMASNTSTISISRLAQSVTRPEQFCGMHFFNPVHLMPLVEIIRGEQTSDQTIANAVAYAVSMKKSPIVVNDCPGFLVNRILFPYFNGFNRLLNDGVDFERIDHVMESFGWPMGPAYLADVIGLDTMEHADIVMQKGFPERMQHDDDVIIERLHAEKLLGQKSGSGFYQYGVDDKGKRFKTANPLAQEMVAEKSTNNTDISDQDIINRMMIPMCLEAARCLEDGIVETPSEVDMGLILGLGFPRFRGGALRYIDTIGLAEFAKQVEANDKHGALYQLNQDFKDRLASNKTYY